MIKHVKYLLCLLMTAFILLHPCASPLDAATFAASGQHDPLRLSVWTDGQLLVEVADSLVSDTVSLVSDTVSDTEIVGHYVPRYAEIDSTEGDAIIAWGTQLRWRDSDEQERLRGSPFYSFRLSELDVMTKENAQSDLFSFGEGDWIKRSKNNPEDDSFDGIWTIRWIWPDDQLELVQTIIYQTGQWFFTIQWSLTNYGSETLTDLDLIHGGDSQITSHANPSTSERVGSSWDEIRSRLILWPRDAWDCGLMFMGGAEASESGSGDRSSQIPDHYQTLAATKLQSVVRQPHLVSDTVLLLDCDQAALLQWVRDELAPGDTWVVSSSQRFTPVGPLQLIGPELRYASPGELVELEFELLYRGQTDILPEFSLSQQSQLDWPWQFLANESVCLLQGDSPGFSQSIQFSALVPDTAVPGEKETISLEVKPRDNPYIFSQASGDVLVTDDLDDPAVSPTPVATPTVLPQATPTEIKPIGSEAESESENSGSSPESTESAAPVVSDTTETTGNTADGTVTEISQPISLTGEINPSTGIQGSDQGHRLIVSLILAIAIFTAIIGFYLIYSILINRKM